VIRWFAYWTEPKCGILTEILRYLRSRLNNFSQYTHLSARGNTLNKCRWCSVWCLVSVSVSAITEIYRNYRAVLREVTCLLPQISNVKKIVLDSEAAVWKAVPKVLPGVQLMGCAFHWTQCIWRKNSKIQELGIAPALKTRGRFGLGTFWLVSSCRSAIANCHGYFTCVVQKLWDTCRIVRAIALHRKVLQNSVQIEFAHTYLHTTQN